MLLFKAAPLLLFKDVPMLLLSRVLMSLFQVRLLPKAGLPSLTTLLNC